MAEQFRTAAGVVVLDPMGPGKWGVFLNNGGRFLGMVELEGAGGQYVATRAGHAPRSCASLKAAVQAVGERP